MNWPGFHIKQPRIFCWTLSESFCFCLQHEIKGALDQIVLSEVEFIKAYFPVFRGTQGFGRIIGGKHINFDCVLFFPLNDIKSENDSCYAGQETFFLPCKPKPDGCIKQMYCRDITQVGCFFGESLQNTATGSFNLHFVLNIEHNLYHFICSYLPKERPQCF